MGGCRAHSIERGTTGRALTLRGGLSTLCKHRMRVDKRTLSFALYTIGY
jgi:hypothetical protein